MKKRIPIIIVSGLLVVSLTGNVVQIVNSQQQIANSEKQISELQAEFSSLEKMNNELLATANQAKQDVDTFKTMVTNLEKELETFKQDDLSEKNEQYIFGKTVGLTDKELETLLGSDYKPSDEVLAAVKSIPSAQTTAPKTSNTKLSTENNNNSNSNNNEYSQTPSNTKPIPPGGWVDDSASEEGYNLGGTIPEGGFGGFPPVG